MKEKVFMIVTVVLMVLTIGIFMYKNVNEKDTDALKFKREYESLNGEKREKDGQTIRSITIDKENPFVYKEAEDIIKMMKKKESFVVYFGFRDCPWCRSVLPSLVEVSKDVNLNTIYYVDIKEIRDTLKVDKEGKILTDVKGTPGYYQLLDALKNVLSDYTLEDEEGNEVKTEEKRIFAPNVISVIKGKATALTEGISDKQTNGYMKLTKEMIQDTKKKFQEILEPVAEELTTCRVGKGC